jgi:hypothetical protein|tara:strand:+ start:1162 stop:1317 length:156 start_codon:yes stop_codon:yes gene_type:complete
MKGIETHNDGASGLNPDIATIFFINSNDLERPLGFNPMKFFLWVGYGSELD